MTMGGHRTLPNRRSRASPVPPVLRGILTSAHASPPAAIAMGLEFAEALFGTRPATEELTAFAMNRPFGRRGPRKETTAFVDAPKSARRISRQKVVSIPCPETRHALLLPIGRVSRPGNWRPIAARYRRAVRVVTLRGTWDNQNLSPTCPGHVLGLSAARWGGVQ